MSAEAIAAARQALKAKGTPVLERTALESIAWSLISIAESLDCLDAMAEDDESAPEPPFRAGETVRVTS